MSLLILLLINVFDQFEAP